MKLAQEQFAELLLQMLETEQGGVKVYETALRCVVNDDLKEGMGEVSLRDDGARPDRDTAHRTL